MRVFIILATIALTHGAKLERTYLPPSHAGTSGGSGNFLEAPVSRNNYQNNGFAQTGNQFPRNGNRDFETQEVVSNAEFNNVNNFENFKARPERAQAALERNAAIIRQDNSNDGETYAYSYETENGIFAEESGAATNGVEAQGGYSYTGDDGQVYSIRYTADQNGFVPQGDHIPTAPPVPEEILKALEQNARDEAAGIYDDGSYHEAKYASINIQQNSFNSNDDDTVVTNATFSRKSVADTPAIAFKSGSSDSVEKAYLPPSAQRANGFGRQSFDSRDGYRY